MVRDLVSTRIGELRENKDGLRLAQSEVEAIKIKIKKRQE